MGRCADIMSEPGGLRVNLMSRCWRVHFAFPHWHAIIEEAELLIMVDRPNGEICDRKN
jgi:hypothetical protein